MAAAAIRDAVTGEDPPLRLVIGQDAHQWISGKVQRQLAAANTATSTLGLN